MKPILEELRRDYPEGLNIEIVDTSENPKLAQSYGVWVPGTLMFLDAEGNELDRHSGVLSAQEIVEFFRAYKIELSSTKAREAEESKASAPRRLLIWATQSVRSRADVALLAALLWGVLSVILSPCHLASIPLIVTAIGSTGKPTLRGAVSVSLLFSLGILITIALLGVVTGLLGRILGDIGVLGYIVAGMLLLFALILMDVLTLPFSPPGNLPTRRRGARAALVIGLLFGLALGPCTFAFLAPVMGVGLSLARSAPVLAAGLLLAYGVGHCMILAGAGLAAGLVQRYLNWNEKTAAATALRRLCGLLVLGGGLWALYMA